MLDLDALTIRSTGIRRGGSSWLLRLPLLPAALRLLRPPPAGGEAQALEHRRLGGRGRGSGAHRWSIAPAGRGCGSWARRRLRAGGADGLVRGDRVDFLFGLARTPAWSSTSTSRSPGPSRCRGHGARPPLRRLPLDDADSWSRRRRVVAKAEWMPGAAQGANPRFVVTSLKAARADAARSTSKCTAPAARWRTASRRANSTSSPTASAATMRANQLRLWFALWHTCSSRRCAHRPRRHRLATATCGSIRLKLLKIGALVTRSVRRTRVAMASSCPDAAAFRLAHARYAADPNHPARHSTPPTNPSTNAPRRRAQPATAPRTREQHDPSPRPTKVPVRNAASSEERADAGRPTTTRYAHPWRIVENPQIQRQTRETSQSNRKQQTKTKKKKKKKNR